MGIKALRFAGGLIAALVFFPSVRCSAQSNARAIVHIPTKSLTSMPLFFGKDKGFFARENVDVDLVLMSPPTAIAALVAGELDFSTTVGAGISATMRGLPIKRILYIQQYVTFALVAAPEIKSVRDLIGKSVGAVALTDATAIAAREIIKGKQRRSIGSKLFLYSKHRKLSYRPAVQKNHCGHAASTLRRGDPSERF